MSRLKLESESIIYRNPTPGYAAVAAVTSYLLPIAGSEVLAFYRKGQAFYSVDGVLTVARSTDGGATWTEEGAVWRPEDDDRPYSYSAPHCLRRRDGTLMLTAKRWDRSNPERPIFNPDTGGIARSEELLFTSTDTGRTWSPPSVLDLPETGGVIDIPSQLIELDNGRLWMPCEVWKTWDDTSPLHIKGFGLFSDDGGKKWIDRVDFPSAGDPEKMYSHSRYTKMLDGRIGALQWTQSIGGQENYNLHWVESNTDATEWTMPAPTSLPGQTSWAADLGDGLVAAVFSRREGAHPGVLAVLSHDGGLTWDTEHEVLVWDAVGQEFLGVEHKPEYPRSHDNIAFGKPGLARLDDGSVSATWWCTQACVTHVRCARLSVE